MKQRRPAATDDGVKDDAVFVDEPELLERRRELGRSDEDTSLGLRFQRRDRLAQVTIHLIVFCRGKWLRELDTKSIVNRRCGRSS